MTARPGSASPTAAAYAPDATVPAVAITPTWPARVEAAAATAPGRTTPSTGTLADLANEGQRLRGGGVAGEDQQLHVLGEQPGHATPG